MPQGVCAGWFEDRVWSTTWVLNGLLLCMITLYGSGMAVGRGVRHKPGYELEEGEVLVDCTFPPGEGMARR